MPSQFPTALYDAMPAWVLLLAAAAAWPAWRSFAGRLAPAILERWNNFPALVLAFVSVTVGFAPTGVLVLAAIGVGAKGVSALTESRGCRLERFLPDDGSAGTLFMSEDECRAYLRRVL